MSRRFAKKPSPAAPAQARFSRPPIERMLRLHERIKAGSFPNCRKLAEEFEVSPKTIQRDVDFMRDRMNLPIEYDQIRFGFYYTEAVEHFPTVAISEGEIIAMFVARKALEQYRGTSFDGHLRSAFRKITEGLRDKVDFQWAGVESAISFHNIGASEADIGIFEAASKAVLQSREIEFDYKKAKSPMYEPRRVHPYHLGCISDQWYLFGFDLDRGQIRTFALPRIKALRITAVKFRRPSDFSIGRHLGDSFGVFSGTGHHRIRIRFDPLAGQIVSERRWHDSQKIKPLPSGGVELRMELNSFQEVEGWILSWGKRAEVLEPPELVERIRATLAKLSAVYAVPPNPTGGSSLR